ncbi:MAG: hypothetical protein KM312_07610 [Hydrogenibacillus schlegelii]|uniref:Uncharacterized protein n=1 Tax=Hydrogenibacillus schlegelii TaxID=1484 RepID=A0A947CY29_HYDSH|nr:hypothetical protein [Hydrogenibacillus schlegelii]
MFEKAPFRPRRRWWLSLLLVMALLGAADVPLFAAAQAAAEAAERAVVLYEGFEQGTKPGYAKGTVNLSTGPWELDDALLGTDARDKKIGKQSVRIQKSGSLTMNFDVTVTEVAYVELWHANAGFSGDVGGKWKLQYSIDQGQTWQDAGPEVPSGSTMEKASFEIHHTGPIRFKVQKTDGRFLRRPASTSTILPSTPCRPPRRPRPSSSSRPTRRTSSLISKNIAPGSFR